MGGELSISNDDSDGFEILQATIFTPGQGICLQRLKPGNSVTFKFDKSLAYGSWYDIQIIRKNLKNNTEVRYLKKGVYLTYGKIITMTELTNEDNRDYGIEWICDECKKPNIGNIVVCDYCHTNQSQKMITKLASIPIISPPFAVADAILKCSRASQSNKMDDKIDAVIAIINAVLDVAFIPFIIDALIKILNKVIAQIGIQVTAKTLFGEAGVTIIKEVARELQGGNFMILQFAKEFVKKTINNDLMQRQ